jgi:hypothetical protein
MVSGAKLGYEKRMAQESYKAEFIRMLDKMGYLFEIV